MRGQSLTHDSQHGCCWTCLTFGNLVQGTIWNEETLYVWLENPQKYIQGTKMDFEGLPEPKDRTDVIEFLKEATGPPVRTNERGEAAGRYGNHG